jgi:hypothetical protein
VPTSNLDHVNGQADAHPGFVWCLIEDDNDANDSEIIDDYSTITNLSVWENIERLLAFVYRNEGRRSIMRRRKECFVHADVYLAL